MLRVLQSEGLRWVIVLANFLSAALGSEAGGELYTSYTARTRDVRMTVVPAAYELPGLPARFFKLMMKGQLPVEEAIDGVRRFAAEHADALLLFKRDGETIFIDAYNSGFSGTEAVFERFVSGLADIADVRFLTIGEFIRSHPPQREVMLDDFLGNTRIETFTEGEAAEAWLLTQRVRKRILEAEQAHPGSGEVQRAWEHLLLSHNSDGRIGYWHSKWNPGEHKVAPSRRAFVIDNLREALRVLGAPE